MNAKLTILAGSLALALAAPAAWAQEGTLTITDGTTTVTLDQAQLAEMEQEVIQTTTVWTEGETTFSGPSVQAVLEQVGFAGETVTAEALDGYGIQIPRERLTGDGAILATSMNGEPLPQDKAPYWIVFPYDESPEMNDQDHQNWSIWALSKITIE